MFFVCYATLEYVHDVLDREFLGDWGVTFGTPVERRDPSGKLEKVVVKATLVVGGITREAFGQGRDEKSAETDALKRAARHFGVCRDLYRFDRNLVPVDGPQRGARPKVDPGEYYWRTQGRKGKPIEVEPPSAPQERGGVSAPSTRADAGVVTPGSPTPPPVNPPVKRTAASSPPPPASSQQTSQNAEFSYAPVPCRTCGARMWDNRKTRKPNQPAFRCTKWKTHGCAGVYWADELERLGLLEETPAAVPDNEGFPPPLEDQPDDLPF
ncbi:MAG TPA: hypothetical protein VKD00_06880 [Methyloceanibacter sp.]|nr:hypothetical protein [Methyloceanibacter sp.]